ncbi:MAG TPA: FtsQ-type POTRA domain-containing protein [Candidatus Dormibacteraeota bacterium]
MQGRRRHSFKSTGKDLSQTTSRRRLSAGPHGAPPSEPWPPRSPHERRPRRSIDAFWRRVFALVLAGVEVFAIGWVLRGDLTTVHQVTVTGLAHLTRQQVVRAAGLDGHASVLVLDGDSIRRDLERLPWVRTASVQPLLPDRVAIAIEEWSPVAVYRNGPQGKLVYLNDQGTTLALATGAGTLPVVQGGASGDPKVGSRPLDAQLLAALVRIQAAFPAVYGQPVSAFQLDCVGSLSLTTSKGVTIYFGRVLTPEEFASLSAKLSALKSITASDPDVANPAKVEYVNLEDVQQPAVKFKGAPPSPAPSPGVRTAPSPSPSGAPSVQVKPCG